MLRGLGPIALMVVLIQCSSQSSSPAGIGTGGNAAACDGSGEHRCAAFCGSDALEQEVCVGGAWRCPEGSVRGADCPPGTCFGYSKCCGPNGETSAKICPKSDSLPSPGAGHCPDGFVDCQFPGADGGAGGGGSGGTGGTGGAGPPDAGALLAECFAQKYSCAFCCGKYFSETRGVFHATLEPCVCAAGGPCQVACGNNGFCGSPGQGPSSTCEPCLLAQLSSGAPCAASVATCASSTCKPYVDCLASCGVPP